MSESIRLPLKDIITAAPYTIYLSSIVFVRKILHERRTIPGSIDRYTVVS